MTLQDLLSLPASILLFATSATLVWIAGTRLAIYGEHVVTGTSPTVPLGTIFRGIWPFWLAMAVVVAAIVAFPNIALLLPNTMFG